MQNNQRIDVNYKQICFNASGVQLLLIPQYTATQNMWTLGIHWGQSNICKHYTDAMLYDERPIPFLNLDHGAFDFSQLWHLLASGDIKS